MDIAGREARRRLAGGAGKFCMTGRNSSLQLRSMNASDDSPSSPAFQEPADEAAVEAMRADWAEVRKLFLQKFGTVQALEARLLWRTKLNEFFVRHGEVMRRSKWQPEWGLNSALQSGNEWGIGEITAEPKPFDALKQLKQIEIELLRILDEKWESLPVPDRIIYLNALMELRTEEDCYLFLLPFGEAEEWRKQRWLRESKLGGMDLLAINPNQRLSLVP
jgi:hypothetical protein